MAQGGQGQVHGRGMHEQVRARTGNGPFQGLAEMLRGLAGGLLQAGEELPDGGVFFQHAGEGLGLVHEVAAQNAHGQFGMIRDQTAHDRREAVAPGTKHVSEIEEVHARSIRFWPGKERPVRARYGRGWRSGPPGFAETGKLF